MLICVPRVVRTALFLIISFIWFCEAAASAVFAPTSFKLKNGLTVVVIENPRAPIVIQMLWYRVGAADEAPGESGLAHFLEHLLFKGTKTTKPGEFSRVVSRLGGEDNAFTSYDYTAYFQVVAAQKLGDVMRLEADRMHNLVLNDAQVLPERDVVIEERKSRTDNSPAAQLREQVRRALYLNHPYGRPVIGWMHEIRSLTTKNAMAFYRKLYAPNNAMLIVAGAINVEAVKVLAKKYFGPIPPRIIPPRIRPKEPPHRAARRVMLRSKQVRLASWSRYYLAPSYSGRKQTGGHSLEVLAQAFGGGATSRLFRRLVVERKIATNVGARYNGDGLDYGEFVVYATPNTGTSIPTLETAVNLEIEALIKEGLTSGDINRAKKLIAAQAVYAKDQLNAGPNAIGAAFTQGRTIDDVESWPERIGAVTPDKVMAAAKRLFNTANSVTGILLPERIN